MHKTGVKARSAWRPSGTERVPRKSSAQHLAGTSDALTAFVGSGYTEASLHLPDVGQPAPDAVFRDAAGDELHFADFWRRQPTVFIFLRHFG